MKLKPYPKYKDSGIQWIGEIPEGWEIGRLKNKTLIKYGSSLSELDRQEGDIDVFGSNGIVGKHNRSITKGKTIIIGRKGSHGKVNLSKDSCFPIDTTYFIDKTCTRLNIKYLFYLLNQLKLDETSRDSAVPGLSRGITYNKIVPYISIKDQTTIASFLDKRTTRIDAMIEKDKKLITLLKEKRTALINHAVTKGLDKNAKMKKVNLLICDENPENWQVIRIKFVIRLSRGVDLSNDDFEEGNIPVYGSNGIIGYHNEATSKGPGVTVGRSGSVGEVNFVNEERYWAHNTSLYLQEDYGNNVRYLYYLLSILDLKHLAAGSAVGTLNRNYIHDLFVSLEAVPQSPNNQ